MFRAALAFFLTRVRSGWVQGTGRMVLCNQTWGSANVVSVHMCVAEGMIKQLQYPLSAPGECRVWQNHP
jgi:hypothetical protein